MNDEAHGSIQVSGDVEHATFVTGSHNVFIQGGTIALQSVKAASIPLRRLRVLAILAAPVLTPRKPDDSPPPLDLRQEWHTLKEEIRQSQAPIHLTRLLPPTLEELRAALSPRSEGQIRFPHVLHFAGHAWKEGLILEDEMGRVTPVRTEKLAEALRGMPHPIDLLVLNGCESAADEVRSAAQGLVEAGITRAAVGHRRPVHDVAAIHFAARLYAELTAGFTLEEAVQEARRAIPSSEVVLVGDRSLHFPQVERRGEPLIDEKLLLGDLPPRTADLFFGRGKQLVAIAEALSHPPACVVLSGPPGIGKSSLMVEAAHRQRWRFQAIAFVEVNATDSQAEVLFRKLAEGLKLNVQKGRARGALEQYTRQFPTLFLLDALEHLPAPEQEEIAHFLTGLGEESAAIIALRPRVQVLEEITHPRIISLHEGLRSSEAQQFARNEAQHRGIPLTEALVRSIAKASEGHPRLIEMLVAQAGNRSLTRLLKEIEARHGDFTDRLKQLYEWNAKRAKKAGRRAWQVLPLFPTGRTPEEVLEAAAGGREGLEALRTAALADFDPALQLWRWHASVADYAHQHWPLEGAAREERLRATLPAWCAWLEALPPEEGGRWAVLEAMAGELEALLDAIHSLPWEAVHSLVRALYKSLPAPDRTLTLRMVEARLYRLWAKRATTVEEQARALGMLGYALSALGKHREASERTKEAVVLYRQLAQTNPQVFRPDLAKALNNLGLWQNDLGQHQEALKAMEEAVEIRRQLARDHPSHLPDLAKSVNNLGTILSSLGRHQTALERTQEAVMLYRKLVRDNPTEAFQGGLARSLNNLGLRFAALGQREEALTATKEAMVYYHQLAQANPPVFLSELARSLGAYGVILLNVGRTTKAADAFAEGLHTLLPILRRYPHAIGKLTAALLRGYRRASRLAGQEPDATLLAEIIPLLPSPE